ncbi:Uncharacterised protein [Mycobacteroides abscessus subsp. abscessus]|nr:Uncharacterised protein [Mycobacteroides abscessus subsp. abscessus]
MTESRGKHAWPYKDSGGVYVDALYGMVFRRSPNPFLEREEVGELLPKRRENTYRNEAVDDWTLGRWTTVVTYYGDRFVRFFDRGGWGEWEDIS